MVHPIYWHETMRPNGLSKSTVIIFFAAMSLRGHQLATITIDRCHPIAVMRPPKEPIIRVTTITTATAATTTTPITITLHT